MKLTNPSSYLTIIVLIILASLNTVYGQGGVGGEGSPTHMNVTPAPPDISSLNKQIDAEASPYAGRANVSIPLYSIKSKSLSIPVTLNYQTSGIKVNDLSGWVGLGWSLSCQYNVNRTILGINDELMAFFDGHVFPYPLDVLSSAHQNSIDAICDGQFEAQPDIFHYSIPGYSGKFVLDVKSRKLVQMEQSNVELRAYFDNTNVLERFVVKDPNGVIYFFSSASQHEVTNTNTTSGIACTGSKNYLNPSNTYSNTGHLTKIADRNRQDSIILVYTSVTSNLIVDVSENHRFADPYNSAGISGCPCCTSSKVSDTTDSITRSRIRSQPIAPIISRATASDSSLNVPQ